MGASPYNNQPHVQQTNSRKNNDTASIIDSFTKIETSPTAGSPYHNKSKSMDGSNIGSTNINNDQTTRRKSSIDVKKNPKAARSYLQVKKIIRKQKQSNTSSILKQF